ASAPRALELAGELADGLILLTGLFPEGLAFAREQLERGRARSPRREFEETLFLYGAVDDDERRAIDAARSIAAWFPKTAPDYARLARMDDELIDAINSAYSGGEFQHARSAAGLVSDDLVRKLAFCGTPAQGEEKLAWLRDAHLGQRLHGRTRHAGGNEPLDPLVGRSRHEDRLELVLELLRVSHAGRVVREPRVVDQALEAQRPAERAPGVLPARPDHDHV